MAAPAYTTDLTLLDDCADNTGWGEPTATNWTSLGTVTSGETDLFIQGTACNSAIAKTGVGGYLFDAGAAGVTIPTDGAFIIWLFWNSPNCLAPFGTAPFDTTEGGIRLVIGNALNAFNAWVVGGSDTYQYGGWICPAANPTVGADYTAGTPNTTYRYFGWCYNAPTAVPSKGNAFNVDACYYGRCQARFTGGQAANYATFAGFATQNDNVNNRWGLISDIGGAYQWKGLISLGVPSSTSATRARATNVATLTTGAAHSLEVGDVVTITGLGGTGYNVTAAVATTPTTTSFTYANTGDNEGQTADTGGTIAGVVDFRDANRNILIENTRKVTNGFNKIQVNQASSRVDWTSISITALGTTASGIFEAVDDADINIDKCTFTDMDTFTFKSNSTITNSTFRRCGQVTQGGCVFTSCSFESSPAAYTLVVDNPTNITYCSFTSDGGNHAMKITAAGNYTFTGHTFTGYAGSDGDSGNEVVYNTSGGEVTLNAAGITGTVSVRNSAGSTTNVESGSVDITVTVKDVDGGLLEDAAVLLVAADGGPFPYDDTVTITRVDNTAIVAHTAHGMATNDKVQITGAAQHDYNGIHQITASGVDYYRYSVSNSPTTPATGTIKSTFVPLHDTTVAGEVTASRKYTSSQPITGRVRLCSSSPLYKDATINDTIDSTNGFTSTVILIEDE